MTTRITITEDDGNVFIDAEAEEHRDLSVFEVVGIIEAAKAVLLDQAGLTG